MADLQLDLNQSLDMKIAQFKNDPDKMRDVNEFLNQMFDQAQIEADQRSNSISKQKGKLETLGIQNGTKKIGIWSNRARTSARVFASRIFTTICNCTNQVRSTLITRNNNN